MAKNDTLLIVGALGIGAFLLRDVFKSTAEGLGDVATSVGDVVTDLGSGISAITEDVTSVTDSLGNLISAPLDVGTDIITGLGDFLSDVGSGFLNLFREKQPEPNFQLATGESIFVPSGARFTSADFNPIVDKVAEIKEPSTTTTIESQAPRTSKSSNRSSDNTTTITPTETKSVETIKEPTKTTIESGTTTSPIATSFSTSAISTSISAGTSTLRFSSPFR